MSPSTDYHDPQVHARRWWILSFLTLSLVLVVLANSILNVALPTLETELPATWTDSQWMVNAYGLVFGGLLLTMGAVGDRFGRRGALQIGLTIFGTASIVTLLAKGAPDIIGVRAAMGVGAALVMPATLSIITTVFPPHERGKAIGIWAAFAGLGGALGPIVGGALIEYVSWQSIFLINVPVVLLALVGTFTIMPTSRDPRKIPMDLVGSFLSIIALGALLYGIIEGPVKDWDSAEVLGSFAISAVGWMAFLLWELKIEHPMLPLQFFKDKGFAVGNITVGLAFFSMFAFFFLITHYLQGLPHKPGATHGYTQLEAGIRTLPFALGLILNAPNSDQIARKLGTPATVTLGLVISALGLGLMGTVVGDTPYSLLAGIFVVLGVGMGMAMAPSTTLIMDGVPRDKAGVGSAMNDTSREVGGAIGIAVLGSIFNSQFRDALGSSALGTPAAFRAFEHAMHTTYFVAAAASLVTAIVVFAFMPRRSGHHMAAPGVPMPGAGAPSVLATPSSLSTRPIVPVQGQAVSPGAATIRPFSASSNPAVQAMKGGMDDDHLFTPLRRRLLDLERRLDRLSAED